MTHYRPTKADGFGLGLLAMGFVLDAEDDNGFVTVFEYAYEQDAA